MAASTFSLVIPWSRKRWIIMPRARSEFKPILTIADSSRVASTSGTFRGWVTIRALLFVAVTPPPRRERPNRLLVPEEKGGFTGLRIMVQPTAVYLAVVHGESNQSAKV